MDSWIQCPLLRNYLIIISHLGVDVRFLGLDCRPSNYLSESVLKEPGQWIVLGERCHFQPKNFSKMHGLFRNNTLLLLVYLVLESSWEPQVTGSMPTNRKLSVILLMLKSIVNRKFDHQILHIAWVCFFWCNILVAFEIHIRYNILILLVYLVVHSTFEPQDTGSIPTAD